MTRYFMMLALLFCMASPAFAFETAAREAIALDYETGAVLFAKEADARTYPASMTKMMTAYLLFSRLASEDVSPEAGFAVSENAWRMGGSKMFVELNQTIPLEALIRGIIVQSGNDACVVAAEGLAGSEEQFAGMMNETATRLGMTGTHFTNSTGWPDENHYTTVHDLALLGLHLIKDFPQYYHYFAEPEFTWHEIRQHNRNLLLYRNLGVDGLKTGHTEEAGYGITVSGKDAGGRRVVIVVHGLSGEKERAEEATKLYQYALAAFDNQTVLKPGAALGALPVWYGEAQQVALTVAAEAPVTLPKLERAAAQFVLSYPTALAAPVAKGAAVGELIIRAPGVSEQRVTLVTADEVRKTGAAGRVLFNLKHLLGLDA
jgi:D-alanyl-D-alanine carboxypeptidase (penicillin-binding protein 5/6)